MLTPTEKLVFAHLSQFVSDHKKECISRVLDHRSRHVTVVLEDIFQSQNASAVIRTCECMGLQDVHIVENKTKYSINPRVLKGANKWMNLRKYASRGADNTTIALEQLKRDGYRILVTDPSEDGTSIFDIDVATSRIALVFGNELRGVSREALDNADVKVRIPMYGFTESLNISVSVAICLNTLVTKMRLSGQSFGLSLSEKEDIQLNWYRKIVRKSSIIEQEFLRTIE
jgi:tRNA (guanosine-2'-O-)-methyltransferase